MPRRRFEVYEVDNGYEVTIYEKPDGEIYKEPTKLVAKTSEEVSKLFTEFIGGEKKKMDGKTMLTDRLDAPHEPPGQGLHLSSGRVG